MHLTMLADILFVDFVGWPGEDREGEDRLEMHFYIQNHNIAYQSNNVTVDVQYFTSSGLPPASEDS